ncbi:MAG TPA: CRISPR-associated protein Cas4 [Chloroflexota bacterium]|nr:CRISPR-associated protein Cas4 [Chloroflexota bacterium]
METETFTIRVIDLKQYVYCPRILYYQTVLPGVRPLTYKMEAGIAAHLVEEEREKRRSLRSYGLTAGDCTFNVPLFSAELGLSGILDMLIETDKELIPVDYKQSKKVGKHTKLQLMAYGRLLELIHPSGKPVHRGFLYLIPQRKATGVSFTRPLRRQLEHTITALHHIIWQQQMPAPLSSVARCVDCEFRRFCNDVR